MRAWKCKQVIDFDKSTTTVKEEGTKLYNSKRQISTIVFKLLHLSHSRDIWWWQLKLKHVRVPSRMQVWYCGCEVGASVLKIKTILKGLCAVTHCEAVVLSIPDLSPTNAGVCKCMDVDQKWLGGHATHQEVSRCHTGGESEDSVAHRLWSTQVRDLFWLWNPGQTSREVRISGRTN